VEANLSGIRVTSGKIAHVGHRIVALLAVAVFAALTLDGCGAAPLDSALSQSQLQSDYKGAPDPLAKLFHKQNQLLSGGTSAFKRELRALRGYPVVVNQWASWCENCREEFAIFQKVAPRFAHKVAFIGDDVNDHRGASWLKRFPLSFPSYDDPDTSIARVLGPLSDVAPVTYFYNRSGQMVYPHAGPYLSASSLEHDIRFYIGG
jgi:cytochrome c biogenesis protein CcmG, thiol:disulfide interchange protein DsbE